jgi:copper chaperone CopZ
VEARLGLTHRPGIHGRDGILTLHTNRVGGLMMIYGRLKAALAGTAALLVVANVLWMPNTAGAEDGVKQTFVVQGLHCPPCTNTVEAALKRTKGVETVKVDWNSKNAWITFDERVISAQQVAQAIAATPHMMGRGMHYQASLALKVPELKDAAAAEKAKTALMQVTGVAAVYAYPQQQSVTVQFQPSGKLATADLIAALKQVGLEATPFK